MGLASQVCPIARARAAHRGASRCASSAAAAAAAAPALQRRRRAASFRRVAAVAVFWSPRRFSTARGSEPPCSGGGSPSQGANSTSSATECPRRGEDGEQGIVVRPNEPTSPALLPLRGEGPILADFLGMGGDSVHVLAPPKVSGLSREPTPSALAKPRVSEEMLRVPRAQLAPVRERRLVEAALRPGKALEQAISESPPFVPLDDPPRRREELPELFQESYHYYLSGDGGGCEPPMEEREAHNARDAGESDAWRVLSGPTRRMFVIRPQPWHREWLQVRLCKAVLYDFVQELREVFRMREWDLPLRKWEVRRARELSAAGRMATLVKFLAETEDHIKCGGMRKKLQEERGTHADAAKRLIWERRMLAQQSRYWERYLSQELLLRDFLDGKLSWRRARELLTSAPLMRAKRPPSEASGQRGP